MDDKYNDKDKGSVEARGPGRQSQEEGARMAETSWSQHEQINSRNVVKASFRGNPGMAHIGYGVVEGFPYDILIKGFDRIDRSVR